MKCSRITFPAGMELAIRKSIHVNHLQRRRNAIANIGYSQINLALPTQIFTHQRLPLWLRPIRGGEKFLKC
jgi:hypothetical protein